MEIPSLDTALVNLSRSFPYYIEFILALLAVGGLLTVFSGMVMGYNHVSAGGRGQTYGEGTPTPWKALGLIVLGGAMSVPLIIMWDVAGTFVFGGGESYNILSYLPAPDTSPWCDRVKWAVILFWMCIGITAIGWSFVLVRDRIIHGRQGVAWQAGVAFLGGIACFFIVSVGQVISNTVGLDISLDNVCTILGSGSGG